MRFLRQSTASQEILLGPFVDDTDGKTPETGLTIANTDIKLLVGGATSEASKNSGGATHISGGRYSAVLDATDTATVGILEVSVNATGALPFTKSYYVLEEAVFDALYAASSPGYLQPTTAGRTLDVASTGEAGIDLTNILLSNGAPILGLIASGTLSGTHSTSTADLGANAPSLSMVGKWLRIPARDVSAYISAYNTGTGVATFSPATAASLTDGDQWYLVDAPYNPTDTTLLPLVRANVVRSGTAQAGAGTTITLDSGASSTDDVYNYQIVYIRSGTGAGQARIITDYVGSTKVATVGTWQTNPDSTSVFDILPFGQIPGASAPTAGEVADAVWDEATSGHTTAGSTSKALIDLGTALTTIAGYIDTEVAAIKAKTDNLPSDPADASDIASSFSSVASTLSAIAGYIDTEVAAIKAKTDQLTFTQSGHVDANVQRINDVLITGDGQSGTEFGV
jgi:hypothetical protein